MFLLAKVFAFVQVVGWGLIILKGLASWIVKTDPYIFDIFSKETLTEVDGLRIVVPWLLLSGFMHLVGTCLFSSNIFLVLLYASALVAIIGAGISYLLFLLTGAVSIHGHVILLSMIVTLALVMWGIHRGTLVADETPKPKRVRAAKCARDTNTTKESELQYPNIARSLTPKVKFKDIHGMTAVKARLKDAAQAVVAPREGGKEKRNGILLFGEPGTGKTFFAEALAGELGVPLLQLSYSDVASQWVGKKTERIKAAFDQARQHQPCVLFIDEVDSFLESRDSGRDDGTKEDRDVVNALLTLMVDIRKCRVLLIAATNHLDRLDAAGIREGRFDFKVEVPLPDAEARVGLLKMGLAKNLPNARVEDSVIEAVARRWNGFNSKRILAVTQELPYQIELAGKSSNPGFDDFMAALRLLQGRKGEAPEDAKRLDELVLTESTREMIDLIAGRMADPEHTEAHGGTLPTGVLFYGPPGTGKTATCKALAKSINWAFLPATGADLARDPKALEKLYAKAKELRPTIVFIDEADELLKSREFSSNTESTNKLLTIMDGVRDRVRDVVWIAATNNPELIDPALLRGGRFTEKVQFDKPGSQRLVEHLRGWLDRRKVKLEVGLTVEDLAELIGDESIANAEAVTQAALNRAVSRRTQPVVVGRADVEQAVLMVLG